MADLNFPNSPVDGQEYDGYIFDGANSVWIYIAQSVATNNEIARVTAAFNKANTALQNTTGVFAGDLTITGNAAIATTITSTYKLTVGGTMALQGGGYRVLSDGNNQTLWKDAADTVNRMRVGYNATAVQGDIMVTNTTAPLILGTNNIERMRIDANGQVGIGASPVNYDALGFPGVKVLAVNGANTGEIDIMHGGIVRGYLYSDNTGINLFTSPQGQNLVFGTLDAEYMRITTNGEVGIGTSNVRFVQANSTTLQISNANLTSRLLLESRSNGVVWGWYVDTAGHIGLFDYKNGREPIRVDANGNVGIGRTDPSYSLDVVGTVNASAVLVNGSPISGGSGGGYFQGNRGDIGSTASLGDIFRVHTNILSQNVTIYSGNNAVATGPLSIASGKVLTIQSGARVSIV